MVSTFDPAEPSEYVPFMIETVSPGSTLSAAFWRVRKGAWADVPELLSLPLGLTKYVRAAAYAVPAPMVARPSGADEASSAAVRARVLVRFTVAWSPSSSLRSGWCPPRAVAASREHAKGDVSPVSPSRGKAPGSEARGRCAPKSAVRGVSYASDSSRLENQMQPRTRCQRSDSASCDGPVWLTGGRPPGARLTHGSQHGGSESGCCYGPVAVRLTGTSGAVQEVEGGGFGPWRRMVRPWVRAVGRAGRSGMLRPAGAQNRAPLTSRDLRGAAGR